MLYSIIHLERQFQLDSASFEGNNSWDYDRANLLQSNLTLHAALAIGQRIDSIPGFLRRIISTRIYQKKKKEKKMLRTYYSCNFVDNNNGYISRTRIFLFLLTKRRDLKIRLRRFLINLTSLSHRWRKKISETLNLYHLNGERSNLELDFCFQKTSESSLEFLASKFKEGSFAQPPQMCCIHI